jgi:ribosomal-protein-alanine N-acetyltransferase
MITRPKLDDLFRALPTLRTERLRITPLGLDHADALFEVYSDSAVTLHTSDSPHADVAVTRERVRDILDRHTQRSGISWSLLLHDEQHAIGHCGLHSVSWANRRGDLGFELASRYWRRGLMTEALGAIVAFAFDVLRFNKLSAHVVGDNEACQGLLAGLGFVQEGLLRQHGFWNGRTHDLKAYGLVAADAVRPTA